MQNCDQNLNLAGTNTEELNPESRFLSFQFNLFLV